MPEIDYRDGHFVRDGRPLFVVGVDYQYYRDRRERWERHLRLLKAAHCNVVTFYVPWRHHQVADGDLDFSGRTAPNRDVVGMLRLCAELGLLAIAKPGPFVHSELNLGGLPDVTSPGNNPAIEPARGHDGEPLLWGYDQGQLPSSEDPIFDAMARQWLEAVGRELAPFQAPNGPLIAVQLNDETLYCTANAPPWTLGYEDPAMAQYRELLRQRHGDIATYNSLHGTTWTNFDEVAAPVLGDQPSRPEQLLQYVDWGDFQWRLRRDSYQRYKGWLGLDVPALSNHAGITPPIEENVPDQAPEAADQVPAEYQGLYADWWLATNRVDADADVYEYGMISWLGVAAYGIADPRTTDLPPADARNEVFQRYVNTAARRRGINMEENWGFARLYHPFSRHPLVPVFQTLLSVAAGCSGYVVFCGVQHDHWDDDLDRVTKRGWPTFPSDAPITPDGETTPLYDAMRMLNAWFAREGDAWLEAERQRDLCWLIDPAAAAIGGWLPQDRVGSHATPRCGSGGFDSASHLLGEAGYWLGAHELNVASLKQLSRWPSCALRSSFLMNTASQQILMDYVHAGGTLILGGDLPTMDLDGRPCRLLADQLQGQRTSHIRSGVIHHESADIFSSPQLPALLADLGLHPRLHTTGQVRAFADQRGEDRWVWLFHLGREEDATCRVEIDGLRLDLQLGPKTCGVVHLRDDQLVSVLLKGRNEVEDVTSHVGVRLGDQEVTGQGDLLRFL